MLFSPLAENENRMTCASPIVSQINIYPVKGMRGCSVSAAAVEPWGLAGDRRWMVVDRARRVLSQREIPALAMIKAELCEEGLDLSSASKSISVRLPNRFSPRQNVVVWGDTVSAQLADRSVNEWLSKRLVVECALVHMNEPRQSRKVACEYQLDAPLTFADESPILITSMSSLRDLSMRTGSAVLMNRFRSNLIIDGTKAWAEDDWKLCKVGSAVLSLAKPCGRCVVTTIDQNTGRRDGSEPLRTLGEFRRSSTGVIFGQYAIPLTLGTIGVGDHVRCIK